MSGPTSGRLGHERGVPLADPLDGHGVFDVVLELGPEKLQQRWSPASEAWRGT
jgi:hypothetical protein